MTEEEHRKWHAEIEADMQRQIKQFKEEIRQIYYRYGLQDIQMKQLIREVFEQEQFFNNLYCTNANDNKEER